MEQLITKLLRDFEDGLSNRRQLIQNLTLAFTAVAGGTAYAQTPAGQSAGTKESPFKTVELDHISYQVNDYRVTRDFYAELMGMEVKNDNGRNQCCCSEAMYRATRPAVKQSECGNSGRLVARLGRELSDQAPTIEPRTNA